MINSEFLFQVIRAFMSRKLMSSVTDEAITINSKVPEMYNALIFYRYFNVKAISADQEKYLYKKY